MLEILRLVASFSLSKHFVFRSKIFECYSDNISSLSLGIVGKNHLHISLLCRMGFVESNKSKAFNRLVYLRFSTCVEYL